MMKLHVASRDAFFEGWPGQPGNRNRPECKEQQATDLIALWTLITLLNAEVE